MFVSVSFPTLLRNYVESAGSLIITIREYHPNAYRDLLYKILNHNPFDMSTSLRAYCNYLCIALHSDNRYALA